MSVGLFPCPEFSCQIESDFAHVYAVGRDDTNSFWSIHSNSIVQVGFFQKLYQRIACEIEFSRTSPDGSRRTATKVSGIGPYGRRQRKNRSHGATDSHYHSIGCWDTFLIRDVAVAKWQTQQI